MCDYLSDDFVMELGNRPLTQEELNRRSLDLVDRLKTTVGWFCPNCRNYHGPQVATCPEPSRFAGLKDRIGQVGNG